MTNIMALIITFHQMSWGTFISNIKVDYELLRYKFVNTKAFNKLWGEDLKKENNKEDKEWSNLQANDAREIALRAVCNKFD